MKIFEKRKPPWSRVLLEKPVGPQVVKKFSVFYESRSLPHSQEPVTCP
jgi:hypothetical protein